VGRLGGRVLRRFEFDWMQRSYLGGSEPLFVALLFGSFTAVRKERWLLAALLASLATVVRPLGVFALLGIGVALVWKRDYRKFLLATAIGTSMVARLSTAVCRGKRRWFTSKPQFFGFKWENSGF
jgi:hypothetical protein